MAQSCESCGRAGPFATMEFAATKLTPGATFRVCAYCVADALEHPA